MSKFLDLNQKTPILVFGLSGRIGSGVSFVRDALFNSLKSYGYQVEILDVSQGILTEYYENKLEPDTKRLSEMSDVDRLRELQKRGNKMRKSSGSNIIASLLISDIIAKHLLKIKDKDESNIFNRIAYIIDSFKHPDEIDLFRNIFGEAFYMIGVVASDDIRKKRLKGRKNYSDEEFYELSEIDGNDKDDFGQKSVKTIEKSDYFFINEYSTRDKIPAETERILKLIFQSDIETPRADEIGMNIAFKSAAQSACLSRQVGASIFSKDGLILATGHNDVPEFGGGLYSSESQIDGRCWNKHAYCTNDKEKSDIMIEITNLLKDCNNVSNEIINQFVNELRKSSIKRLLEFSRSIHAEMAAILSVTRSGKQGIVGSTLYCTTYPCHNCAKHIVGAGIARLVYLEPYEKSLARKLHDDSIASLDNEYDKVHIELYGGVAPRRYDMFFTPSSERKHNGKYEQHERERLTRMPLGAQGTIILQTKLENFVNQQLSQGDING